MPDIEKEFKMLENYGFKNLYTEFRSKDIQIKFENDFKTLHLDGLLFYQNKEKQNRYFLTIQIDDGSKKQNNELTVIMLNPSEKQTQNNFIDNTITNVIKIAYDNNYNKINILNLIPVIDTNAKNISSCNFKKENTNLILSFIKDNCSDILVAWGEKYPSKTKNLEVKKIIEELKNRINVFTFCPSKKHFPKHPARLDLDCCRNCFGRNNLSKYKWA